jgi:acetyltransferase-like isoleucine patch superfamily enzyme
MAMRMVARLEGGELFSPTLRVLLREHCGVDVGMYSYGACLTPGALPPGTSVGNYCSLAVQVTVLRRNHPVDRISLHPFFFNRESGVIPHDTIAAGTSNPLRIGHDVWIGHDAIITPSCKSIGDSSVVAAGAVVTEDVPPFAIVGGVPARLIRARLPEEFQRIVAETQWWLKPLPELEKFVPHFCRTLSLEQARQFREEYFGAGVAGRQLEPVGK